MKRLVVLLLAAGRDFSPILSVPFSVCSFYIRSPVKSGNMQESVFKGITRYIKMAIFILLCSLMSSKMSEIGFWKSTA